MDDNAIIALYHARNERAIKETSNKYGAFCRRIALNILSLREDAEECVSDTWLTAWNRMPPERPNHLRAFLGRIVRNLSISRYRAIHAQKRFAGMEILLSELEECVPHPDTVERRLEAEALTQLLNSWLDGLSPEDRALFVRRYWCGEGIKQLAAISGMSANLVSQRLLRLRKRLKDHLEVEGVEL